MNPFREYEMSDRTHWTGCYEAHHECAIEKILTLTLERGDCAAEVLRLREAIRNAPHAPDCNVMTLAGGHHIRVEGDGECKCWKREVLDE